MSVNSFNPVEFNNDRVLLRESSEKRLKTIISRQHACSLICTSITLVTVPIFFIAMAGSNQYDDELAKCQKMRLGGACDYDRIQSSRYFALEIAAGTTALVSLISTTIFCIAWLRNRSQALLRNSQQELT